MATLAQFEEAFGGAAEDTDVLALLQKTTRPFLLRRLKVRVRERVAVRCCVCPEEETRCESPVVILATRFFFFWSGGGRRRDSRQKRGRSLHSADRDAKRWEEGRNGRGVLSISGCLLAKWG